MAVSGGLQKQLIRVISNNISSNTGKNIGNKSQHGNKIKSVFIIFKHVSNKEIIFVKAGSDKIIYPC